jgi:hypothetical protein
MTNSFSFLINCNRLAKCKHIFLALCCASLVISIRKLCMIRSLNQQSTAPTMFVYILRHVLQLCRIHVHFWTYYCVSLYGGLYSTSSVRAERMIIDCSTCKFRRIASHNTRRPSKWQVKRAFYYSGHPS